MEMDDSGVLFELIRSMMRTDPALRVDVGTVWAHPVVARTRAAMDRMRTRALRAREPAFAASPLGPVPDGFLEEILGDAARMGMGVLEEAMDISP